MKKIATLLAMLTLCVASTAFAANQVRISQVYGGGGATSGTPTYTNDYVEIFNSGATSVDISGWTIEYGSATGNWGSSSANIFTFPSGSSIAPCSYVLVSGAAGTAGGALPVTADYSGTFNASATSGKFALFNAVNTNLACGSELAGTLVDKIAYGTATCSEGTVCGGLTTTSGAVRNLGGMTDTDNNASDFTVTTSPVPHNKNSATNPNCSVVPTRTSTWGAIKSIYR